MERISKFAKVASLTPEAADMEAINRQSLRELSADEVFTFRLAACNDQVDRDNERFSREALAELAQLYVGKPILRDHKWSAETQQARIYAASVDEQDGVARLILRCYMLRNAATETAIQAIEGGILREVSVGCCVSAAKCSICGADRINSMCQHRPGSEYDGNACYIELSHCNDAYECSFVAVPAQPGAEVIKRWQGGEETKTKNAEDEDHDDAVTRRALALVEIAEKF